MYVRVCVCACACMCACVHVCVRVCKHGFSTSLAFLPLCLCGAVGQVTEWHQVLDYKRLVQRGGGARGKRCKLLHTHTRTHTYTHTFAPLLPLLVSPLFPLAFYPSQATSLMLPSSLQPLTRASSTRYRSSLNVVPLFVCFFFSATLACMACTCVLPFSSPLHATSMLLHTRTHTQAHTSTHTRTHKHTHARTHKCMPPCPYHAPFDSASQGISAFMVPKPTEGLTLGKKEDKVSHHPAPPISSPLCLLSMFFSPPFTP